ncbi:MAG: CinA family protein [Promethearchaeota archaeon]|nr:MAG: CinA family protein [Candidatus Lokiarchaeota archaeon]
MINMDVLERIGKIVDKLTERRIRIAIAESCTGGYVSHMITNIAGASNVFERGVISYSNQSKTDLLNVDSKLIERFGAVSEEVAREMAEGVRIISRRTDLGIGITGIAGPTGGTPEKPVGLVFIGFSTENDETLVKKFNYEADRITFKQKVLQEIIDYLDSFDSK